MPMMGATDTIKAKPKFPVERIQHGTITVSVNTAANGATTIAFPPGAAAGIANGWVANGVNIGSVGVVGFDVIGPTVTNITTNTITLSSGITGNLVAGQQITFSKPVNYKVNVAANTLNANTYLVSTKRVNNANSILYHSVAHEGWVAVKVGTGFVKAVNWKNAGNQYANGFLTITANTQFPGGTGANASYTVNANGALSSITINSNGSGYVVTPTVSVPFSGNPANAVNATLTVVMGGRANRIQAEVLATTANGVATDPNSGGWWFPGV